MPAPQEPLHSHCEGKQQTVVPCGMARQDYEIIDQVLHLQEVGQDPSTRASINFQLPISSQSSPPCLYPAHYGATSVTVIIRLISALVESVV